MSDIRKRVALYVFEKLLDALIVIAVTALVWTVISFAFSLDFT